MLLTVQNAEKWDPNISNIVGEHVLTSKRKIPCLEIMNNNDIISIKLKKIQKLTISGKFDPLKVCRESKYIKLRISNFLGEHVLASTRDITCLKMVYNNEMK